MPIRHVLALSFSHASFSIAYSNARTAYSPNPEMGVTDFDLGLDHLPLSRDHQGVFWKKIHDEVVHFLHVCSTKRKPITTLLVFGEGANYPTFKATVRNALLELKAACDVDTLMETAEMRSTGKDPVYIVAEGAAIFAKRSQESAPGCIEPSWCRDILLPDYIDKGQQQLSEDL